MNLLFTECLHFVKMRAFASMQNLALYKNSGVLTGEKILSNLNTSAFFCCHCV